MALQLQEEMRLSKQLLPEKFSIDIMQDYLDCSLTKGIMELTKGLEDDDAKLSSKIEVVKALVQVGRYVEQRKQNQLDREKDLDDLEDDVDFEEDI